MEHALGRYARRQRDFRNHFVAGPDHEDWPILQGLCERGLMCAGRPSKALGGMSIFVVTDAGKAKLKEAT
jgi:hypothetical protein